MDSCSFNIATSALACEIANGKSSEEIALLSAFFTQLGDSLATIDAYNSLKDACCEKNQNPTEII